jgi:uncharacterized protein
MVPRRLARLPAHDIGRGLAIHEARTPAARLLGLALLRELPRGHALLLRRCRSVHTFGMRFPLDVAFLSADGTVVRLVRDVRPGRLVRCGPPAADVLETRAGEAGLFLSSTGSGSSRCGAPCP